MERLGRGAVGRIDEKQAAGGDAGIVGQRPRQEDLHRQRVDIAEIGAVGVEMRLADGFAARLVGRVDGKDHVILRVAHCGWRWLARPIRSFHRAIRIEALVVNWRLAIYIALNTPRQGDRKCSSPASITSLPSPPMPRAISPSTPTPSACAWCRSRTTSPTAPPN